jgi:hypothetical protein
MGRRYKLINCIESKQYRWQLRENVETKTQHVFFCRVAREREMGRNLRSYKTKKIQKRKVIPMISERRGVATALAG